MSHLEKLSLGKITQAGRGRAAASGGAEMRSGPLAPGPVSFLPCPLPRPPGFAATLAGSFFSF